MLLKDVALNYYTIKRILNPILNRENDVAAVDVNMGCPKEYSTKVSPAFVSDIYLCYIHTYTYTYIFLYLI